MNRILLLLIGLMLHQYSFSQSERMLTGTVMNDTLPIQNVEVINFSTKKNTVTNTSGVFSIAANQRDTLLFFLKNYDPKRVIVTSEIITSGNIIVALRVKAIELDEVLIEKGIPMHIILSQNQIDEAKRDWDQAHPKNPFVYDGSIVNGVDFIRLGKDIISLGKLIFNGNDDSTNVGRQLKFKDYLNSNIDEKYYLETLKLKPDEIALFIEFSDADPMSKTLTTHINILTTMDFLLAKSIAFKKLSTGNE